MTDLIIWFIAVGSFTYVAALIALLSGRSK